MMQVDCYRIKRVSIANLDLRGVPVSGISIKWPDIGFSNDMAGRLHIGTSGWSYRDWTEIFYPKHIKSSDWLTHYSQTFDCTEINSSFYRLPKQETVKGWMRKVPKDFMFCPKMSRFLTHMKKLRDPEEPLSRFFGIFQPMKKQIGPVLIQLPKTVAFHSDVTEGFYKLLKKKYRSYSFAMEVRHDTWFTKESIDLMKAYDVSFVMSHSGNHFPYAEHVTSHHIYFRFHGPGTLYNTKYDEETMRKFARSFRRWLKKGHELWIFFNNDWYGYGIENALSLRKYVLKPPAPAG